MRKSGRVDFEAEGANAGWIKCEWACCVLRTERRVSGA